jgi:hypothetical protein
LIAIEGIDKDPDRNIHAGVKYLRLLTDKYLDDPGLDDKNRTLMTFAAYNRVQAISESSDDWPRIPDSIRTSGSIMSSTRPQRSSGARPSSTSATSTSSTSPTGWRANA